MAFVIKKKDSFIQPVIIKEPKDGGGYEEQTIELEFKLMKESELRALIKASASDVEFCKKVVLSWKDVTNSAGMALDFEAVFESFLDGPKVAASISNAYLKVFDGIIEKN